nr:hypothetical protein [uncultured Carboxylicivirga sp.]
MKKTLLTLSILLWGFQIGAQSLIEGVFEQKSEFVKLSENRKCKFKIGLGSIQSEQESGYVLFFFHHSIGRNNTEYSLLIKTSKESDNEVLLSKTQIQPMDKYGDAIISFYLPNDVIDKIKNEKIVNYCLLKSNQFNSTKTAENIVIPSNQPAQEFFITYADLLEK